MKGSFCWAADSGLLLELGELVDDLIFEFDPKVVGLFQIDLPFLPPKSIVFKP